MDRKLTVEAVHNLMRHALYSPDELDGDRTPDNAVLVACVVHSFGFHPQRLKEKKPEIDALLLELHDNFQKDNGGGWTFLNACKDKHNNHWGEHKDVEALLALGIGVGSASFLAPRDVWKAFPHGMPYFEVHPEK